MKKEEIIALEDAFEASQETINDRDEEIINLKKEKDRLLGSLVIFNEYLSKHGSSELQNILFLIEKELIKKYGIKYPDFFEKAEAVLILTETFKNTLLDKT